MQKIFVILAALAAAGATLGPAGPSGAASELHDDGTGFVAAQDVRNALGWDGATFQARAASLEFVAESVSTTTITWECRDTGTAEVLPQRMQLVVSESRALSSVPRTGWWWTVVGFRLEGYDGRGASSAVPEGPAPNSCPAGAWTPVEGSTRTVEEAGGTVLTVVHEGVRHRVPMPVPAA